MDPTHEIRGHLTPLAFAPSNFRHSTSVHLLLGLKNSFLSHGVLKKGLKKHLNPPFLYRLGGLKNSTTIKQEPRFMSFTSDYSGRRKEKRPWPLRGMSRNSAALVRRTTPALVLRSRRVVLLLTAQARGALGRKLLRGLDVSQCGSCPFGFWEQRPPPRCLERERHKPTFKHTRLQYE